MRIKEITDTRVHYGYRRVHVMLRREGHQDNVKRVYRLYRQEGLSLCLKRPRRNKAAKLRQPRQIAFAINEVWTLNMICTWRGLPKAIKTDDGSEFISKAMDKWAYECHVELDFSRPGRPTDNARVESFNGRLRQECLNAHWFLSMDDARGKIAAWRAYYNESRPHSALDWATPAEFARNCRLEPAIAIPEEPEVPTSDRY